MNGRDSAGEPFLAPSVLLILIRSEAETNSVFGDLDIQGYGLEHAANLEIIDWPQVHRLLVHSLPRQTAITTLSKQNGGGFTI